VSVAQRVDEVARRSYGRLVAWLAWQWRDIAAAEDALADAFAAALARWPVDGIPDAPEGWLLTVAKRNLLMAARHQRLVDDPACTVLLPSEHDAAPEAASLPDSRLRLMFVCAHPAIDSSLHAALMLQTVLGLDAARIASAFLLKPEAMSKRLVRAKNKIRETAIRFEEPGKDEYPDRLGSVLEAIYAAYTLHWGQVDMAFSSELVSEAMYLGELVAAQLPDEPEALGLMALLCLCEARKPARLDAEGGFIALHQQVPGQWDRDLVVTANTCLARAASLAHPGPFQLEAAIQAAHMQGVMSGDVPWSAIVQLYERLLALAATLGARIAHAVAVGHARDDVHEGLRLLDDIPAAGVAAHQPWWAARAHLLAMGGMHAEAADAYGRAIGLSAEPALRSYLDGRRKACLALASRDSC